jgi:hypothetical protein
MDLNDYDMKGRAVAHYFFDELEKIAVSSKLVRSGAQEAQRRAGELGKQLGLRRFIPFTKSHRAYDAARRRASRLAQAADKRQLSERQAILDRTRKTGRITRQDIAALKKLEEQGAPSGELAAFGRRVRRATGTETAPPPRPNPSMMSDPRVRRAAAAVGLPLAGAGALYAGQQYLNSKQDPYGGY